MHVTIPSTRIRLSFDKWIEYAWQMHHPYRLFGKDTLPRNVTHFYHCAVQETLSSVDQ